MEHGEWIKDITEMDKKNPLPYKDDAVLRPQYVMQELHRLTKGDAIVATGPAHEASTGQTHRPRVSAMERSP